MSTLTTMRVRFGWAQWLLLAWAVVTFLLSLLPEGVGHDPRALNALLFLCLGPACALMLLLRGALPASGAAVVALGASLGILVLSSQLLLILGAWTAGGVTAIVAVVTIVVAFTPWRIPLRRSEP
ncbi:MAG TPA: hypothetical protein VFO98_05705 [Marmoricola sp.]|jgi:hypothetical protein|nr:hypothetical protein [Marmoricola sp.]